MVGCFFESLHNEWRKFIQTGMEVYIFYTSNAWEYVQMEKIEDDTSVVQI